MEGKRTKQVLSNIALLAAALGLCFLLIELYYRLIDPFPYIPGWEINHTEHGNLSEFDETLGWKGVPGGSALFVTENARVRLEHNSSGFRDIEHDESSRQRPAVVFLGDSFAWGYEVRTDQMFVNIIRDKLSRFEVYNLSHRGYGTDQSLITFQRWHNKRKLNLVVLIFSPNDIDDNNRKLQYGKQKPRFEAVDDNLILTNVPVPRSEGWQETRTVRDGPSSLRDWAALVIYQSHFLHDVYFRIKQYRLKLKMEGKAPEDKRDSDLTLTARIIKELRDEVARRGGELTVVAVPSKGEIIGERGYVPYQPSIKSICDELKIDFLDLAPYFKNRFYRTYYKSGVHWNDTGHKVAADAVYEYLKDRGHI